MANETDRPKEPVKIRFKTLKNGNKSIYFDIYANGVRKYEFLKLYLYPETTTASKQHNRMTMQAVNVLKSKRVVDLTNQRCGITANDIANKITLGDFFTSYIERRRKTHPKGLRLFTNLLRHLEGWRMAGVKLSQLDKPFCEKVISKLRAQEWTDTTKHNNVTFFTMVLNEAVRAGLMTVNPMRLIPPTDKIKMPESNREFLALEELQLIINYQPPKRCRVARLVKRAFLFACFSGLRVSDICALCWRDIQTAENGGLPFVRMTMQKTKRAVNVPLCDDAVMWLPDRPDTATDDARVFAGLKAQSASLTATRIAKEAGVTKHVSFHTARHTFATMLLTFGADIYTVSKLLGHSSVTTTQIYAKIVDAKKQEAISLFNGKFTTQADTLEDNASE